jgi:hypothetical protein
VSRHHVRRVTLDVLRVLAHNASIRSHCSALTRNTVPRGFLRILKSGQTRANISPVSIPASRLSRTSEIETPVFHFDDAASSPGPSRSGCLNRDVALGRYSLGSSATAPIAMTPRGPSPSVRQMYAWAPIRISSRHCGVDQYMYWFLCATSEFIPALSYHFRGFPCHMKPSALNLWPNICHSVPAVTASCRALQYDHATPPSTAAPSPRCDPPLARSCPPTHPPPAAGRAGS